MIAQILASPSTRGRWSWAPSEFEVDPANCGDASAFDPAITETRLILACANLNDCTVQFEEIDNGDTLSFQIRPPRLNAPAVIAYRGDALDEFGNTAEFEQTLCLQSINEAPLARDDYYRVVAGKLRSVNGDASESLLHNDSDDDDIRNQPLMIDTVPIIAPQYAADFTLLNDGGFRYRPVTNATADADGVIRDSFTYAVSDGLHRTTATAHLEIVTDNRSPVRNDRMPDIDVALDELQNGLFEFIVSDELRENRIAANVSFRAGVQNLRLELPSIGRCHQDTRAAFDHVRIGDHDAVRAKDCGGPLPPWGRGAEDPAGWGSCRNPRKPVNRAPKRAEIGVSDPTWTRGPDWGISGSKRRTTGDRTTCPTQK